MSSTYQPIFDSEHHFWKPVAAGYVAGNVGLIVGHPLDSIKVLLQNSPSPESNINNATSQRLPSTISSSSSMSKSMKPSQGAVGTMQRRSLLTLAAPEKRTLRSLYAGIGTPMVTVGLVQSINFGLYDSFRRILYELDDANDKSLSYREHDSLRNIFWASLGAGSIVSIITSPLVIIKTKQQLMDWSLRHAVENTLKQPGGIVQNFYTGFKMHLFCDAMGRSIFFAAYEFFKRTIQERNKRLSIDDANYCHPTLSIPERMFSACVAGMLSWAFIFPFDVIRSKTYAHTVLSPEKVIPSPVEFARRIWETEGKSLRPFFRGIGVTVARSGPVAAAALPVYDLTLEWLTKMD